VTDSERSNRLLQDREAVCPEEALNAR
jgi:hypothetical protein